MQKFTKEELIKILRENAEKTLDFCKHAESDKSMTAEQLEKRITKGL